MSSNSVLGLVFATFALISSSSSAVAQPAQPSAGDPSASSPPAGSPTRVEEGVAGGASVAPSSPATPTSEAATPLSAGPPTDAAPGMAQAEGGANTSRASAPSAGPRAPDRTAAASRSSESPRPDERSSAKERPSDNVFDLDVDDPRVPSFLRALRAGKDSLMLGGWIRPGFTYVVDSDFNEDDADGFEFYDARLIGRGDLRIARDFGASFRFNFDVNRGNFAVRDTYGTLWYRNDLAALDVGLLKTPLGLSLLQSQSSMQLPVNTILRRLAFGRDLGAQLRTEFSVGQVWMHVAAMVSNGDSGFRQRRNIDDSLVVTGRVEVAPFGKMKREEADLANSDFQLALGFSAGHSGALTNDLGLQDTGAEETKLEGDLRMWFRGASVRAEYLRCMRGDNDAGPGFARYGLSVQAGYVLPIPLSLPKFEVVARLQQADVNSSLAGDEGADYLIDNAEMRVIDIGVNAYFAKHAAKLQVAYQLTDLLEGSVPTGEDVPVGDAVLVSAQFGWL